MFVLCICSCKKGLSVKILSCNLIIIKINEKYNIKYESSLNNYEKKAQVLTNNSQCN